MELPDRHSVVCIALSNVSFCYVGDDTNFWL